MTANYKIDIFKNDTSLKNFKTSEYIYFIVYAFIFIFYTIYTLWQGKGLGHWQIGLAAFVLGMSSYLRVSGKTIYKRYFLITDTDIKWQRAIFSTVNIQLEHINEINFQNSPIEFHLINGNAKYFSLANIAVQEVDEIKKLLYNVSIKKSIKYVSNSNITLREKVSSNTVSK